MTIRDDLTFFKEQFAGDILPALAGTPLSFDLISAIAYQETGELWSKMRLHLPRDEILRLCVGDTLDSPSRVAFPRNRGALVEAKRGKEMFKIAHRLLTEMGDATGIEIYQRLGKQPDKFVHGYGIFQYDLQHFKDEDPDFFLEQRWKNISDCVEKLLKELNKALDQLQLSNEKSLSDLQSAFVAIVYNTGFGNFDERRGLQQGHRDGELFYGEHIAHLLEVAHGISTQATATTGAVAVVAPVSLPAATPSIVTVAKGEFDNFHGIDEGSQPLRSRIADYYEAGGGSRNLDPTLNDNAWSAAFVSFCVKRSGATADQFKFDLQHSMFVHAAIANQDADRGVFRGHPITEYSPKLGDIIHHNRSGAKLTFDFARAHDRYSSHSAIVVDLPVIGGVRHAVTVGGNEGLAGGSGTVGTKRFPLDPNGFLDQSAITVRLISVIENKLAAGAPPAVQALGAFMVNARSDLTLRGGPGTDFAKIASLVNGTKLDVLEFVDNASGRWALVDLNSDGVRDGFVFAKFLVAATT